MDMTVGNDYGTALKEMKSRMESIRKTKYSSRVKKTTKKKKKLSYNPREISGQLMHVSRSMGAAQVLVRAKVKVMQLQKSLATGDYNEAEVRAALVHAKRMVKAAKMKMRHLEEEEDVESEKKKRESSGNTNSIQQELRLLEQELKKLRQKNRGEEDREVRNAHMRYMQAKANLARAERSESGSQPVSAGSADAAPVMEEMSAGDAGADTSVAVDVCL